MVSAKSNQNGDNIEDLSAEQDGLLEELELRPFVGDEFQAEIPALITGPEYGSYLKRLVDAENKDHVPYDFVVGLSVPVTWIRNKKDEMLDFSTQSTDAPLRFGSVRETIEPCYVLVPGVCRDDLWNDIEEASFLLGLYLFKKKFVELKNFIGSKKMGDILFFYYTKFYRSTGFNRWSKSIQAGRKEEWAGTWLFSGLKHKELLSRLNSQVSLKCQKMLKEVTETYEKKDMSLIEYAFSIKSMVGLETFVDAVAIGKGVQDLTSMVMRVKRPVDKACSNIRHAGIVKFLTGDSRLTKTQSNVLFWEAVWPRLLARGWRQLGSLVFLTPGVEKFSRELVKGSHYYDSVTDVLDKVFFEPELLELDSENDEGEKKEEKGLIEETNEQQNLPKRRRYWQPQTPICDMDVKKSTVFDTSLDNGKVLKSRKSKTLPMDMSEIIIVSSDSDEDTSDVSTIKADCTHNMLVDQETNFTTQGKTLQDTENLFHGSSHQLVQIDGPDTMEPVKKAKEQKLYGDKQAREPVDNQLSQKLKQNNLDTLLSVAKRHRTAAASSNEEIGSGRNSFPLDPKLGDIYGLCPDVLDRNSKAFSQVGSSKNRWAFTNSAKENPCWSSRSSQDVDCHDQENSQTPIFIDLTDSADSQEDKNTQQDDICVPKTSADISVPEQPIHMNSRRQSTRNRPPTARALEALVNGDLTVKTRRKKDTYAH